MSEVLTISIVGGFQRGKSSLVNALLGCNVAEMGRGLSTTHENSLYSLSPAVSIIDTPGFDANGEDDGTAASAIDKSDVVVYVHASNQLGQKYDDVFNRALAARKKMVFLLNCRKFEKWSPDENDDIVSTIEAELETKRLKPITIPLNGRIVTPINILWARFGLGLIDSDSKEDMRDIRKIRSYSEDDLDIAAESGALRTEMLRRSGFLPVRDFLKNLPLELLKHAVTHPEQEINRIVDRFAAEFKKRWSAA